MSQWPEGYRRPELRPSPVHPAVLHGHERIRTRPYSPRVRGRVDPPRRVDNPHPNPKWTAKRRQVAWALNVRLDPNATLTPSQTSTPTSPDTTPDVRPHTPHSPHENIRFPTTRSAAHHSPQSAAHHSPREDEPRFPVVLALPIPEETQLPVSPDHPHPHDLRVPLRPEAHRLHDTCQPQPSRRRSPRRHPRGSRDHYTFDKSLRPHNTTPPVHGSHNSSRHG